MSDEPRQTAWYRDLEDGTGAAKPLDPALRSALAVAVACRALELARDERFKREKAESAARSAKEFADGRARELAAPRGKAERAAAADQRKSVGSSTTVVFVVLAVTVLAPWLIGFLLRDTSLLPGTVETPDARDLWAYFGAFYLTGLAALGALYAFVLLIRTRKGRSNGATVGLVVLLVTLPAVALLPARAAWDGAEAATAEVIRTTPPGHAECDGAFACAMVPDAGGEMIWSASLKTDDGTLIVYRGWDSVISGATLAVDGIYTPSQVAIYVGDSPKASVVIVTSGQDYSTYGFRLDTLEQLWGNATLGAGYLSVPVQAGPLMIATSHDWQAIAFDPLTGGAKWGRSCPPTFNAGVIFDGPGFDASDPSQIVILCTSNAGASERFGILTSTGAITDLGPA